MNRSLSTWSPVFPAVIAIISSGPIHAEDHGFAGPLAWAAIQSTPEFQAFLRRTNNDTRRLYANVTREQALSSATARENAKLRTEKIEFERRIRADTAARQEYDAITRAYYDEALMSPVEKTTLQNYYELPSNALSRSFEAVVRRQLSIDREREAIRRGNSLARVALVRERERELGHETTADTIAIWRDVLAEDHANLLAHQRLVSLLLDIGDDAGARVQYLEALKFAVTDEEKIDLAILGLRESFVQTSVAGAVDDAIRTAQGLDAALPPRQRRLGFDRRLVQILIVARTEGVRYRSQLDTAYADLGRAHRASPADKGITEDYARARLLTSAAQLIARYETLFKGKSFPDFSRADDTTSFAAMAWVFQRLFQAVDNQRLARTMADLLVMISFAKPLANPDDSARLQVFALANVSTFLAPDSPLAVALQTTRSKLLAANSRAAREPDFVAPARGSFIELVDAMGDMMKSIAPSLAEALAILQTVRGDDRSTRAFQFEIAEYVGLVAKFQAIKGDGEASLRNLTELDAALKAIGDRDPADIRIRVLRFNVAMMRIAGGAYGTEAGSKAALATADDTLASLRKTSIAPSKLAKMQSDLAAAKAHPITPPPALEALEAMMLQELQGASPATQR